LLRVYAESCPGTPVRKLIHAMVPKSPTIASAAMPATLKRTSFDPSMLHALGFKERTLLDVGIDFGLLPFLSLLQFRWRRRL
jgi:hypothetical protein